MSKITKEEALELLSKTTEMFNNNINHSTKHTNQLEFKRKQSVRKIEQHIQAQDNKLNAIREAMRSQYNYGTKEKVYDQIKQILKESDNDE